MLAVETRVKWPGSEGYHIEDMVAALEQGPDVVITSKNAGNLMGLRGPDSPNPVPGPFMTRNFSGLIRRTCP